MMNDYEAMTEETDHWSNFRKIIITALLSRLILGREGLWNKVLNNALSSDSRLRWSCHVGKE